MNYIRHLNSFYEKLAADDRFNPCHISLYLALFQCWNMVHFENPVSINRAQVLNLSKIGSNHTYYKALNDLSSWGYIQYVPSRTRQKGSLIHMCIFAPGTPENLSDSELQRCKSAPVTSAEMHPDESNNAPMIGAKMHPSLNNTNTNNKTVCEEQAKNDNQILNSMNTKNFNLKLCHPEKSKRKKVAQKKEKFKSIPPAMDEIIAFFKSENYPELEARKFFNHFESNGWKVGGKTPMKNWCAAARNWMFNCQRFIKPGETRPQQKPGPNNKNYSEPL